MEDEKNYKVFMQIKNDVEMEDYTAIDELLLNVKTENLIAYLPEDEENNTLTRDEILSKVFLEMKNDVKMKDYTAIDELLGFTTEKDAKNYLLEE